MIKVKNLKALPKKDKNRIDDFRELITEDAINQNSKMSASRLNDIAKQGVFTGGRPPFGYQSVTMVIQRFGRNKERKVLDLHPENAKIVKIIFKLYQSEEPGEPFDANKISLYLNESNLFKNGKRWTTLSVKKILENTLYQGKREYGRNRLRGDLCNEIVVMPIPPIVSKTHFDQVQHELTKKDRY